MIERFSFIITDCIMNEKPNTLAFFEAIIHDFFKIIFYIFDNLGIINFKTWISFEKRASPDRNHATKELSDSTTKGAPLGCGSGACPG